MSFWNWLKETYPMRIIEWLKRLPWNFIMYFVGLIGGCMAFPTSLFYIFTGYADEGALLLCLSVGGFILGQYGWYRQFVRGSNRRVK